MLAVDLLEFLGGRLVFLATEIVERAVIEHLHRLLGEGVVLRAAEPAAAGQRRRRDGQHQCAARVANNGDQLLRHIPSVKPIVPRGLYHAELKKRGARRPLER